MLLTQERTTQRNKAVKSLKRVNQRLSNISEYLSVNPMCDIALGEIKNLTCKKVELVKEIKTLEELVIL